jgi:hypothetical protein
MTPHEASYITASPVAPSLRRLRSGTSREQHDCQGELITHNSGTAQKDPTYRTEECLQTDMGEGEEVDFVKAILLSAQKPFLTDCQYRTAGLYHHKHRHRKSHNGS